MDYSRFPDDSFAVPDASITLRDPTGVAFASQDLPRGALTVSAFADRYGVFSFYDGNGDDIVYGSIGFRIDAIGAVPEPGSLILLSIGFAATAARLTRRRGIRSSPGPNIARPCAGADPGQGPRPRRSRSSPVHGRVRRAWSSVGSFTSLQLIGDR